MQGKFVVLSLLIAATYTSAQDIIRSEKGRGGNANIGDTGKPNAQGKQVSGLLSIWKIASGVDCTKVYGKVINVPQGTHMIYLVNGVCNSAQNTDPKTLQNSGPNFIGTVQSGSNAEGTYIIVNNNIKGLDPASVGSMSYLIVSQTAGVVGCGGIQMGDMVVLKRTGVDEGKCS